MTSTISHPSPSEPTTLEKERGLPWSIAANACVTIFSQFTFFGSVFVLFLSELGLSKTEVGGLLSLLPFCGLVALFITPAVARFGYKRTYITFFTLRSVVAAFLLFTPLVVARWSESGALFYVAVIIGLFAISRSIGMTGYMPWAQEFVPSAVRGKYTASNNIFSTLSGFFSVTAAGFVISSIPGLSGFMVLNCHRCTL